MLCTLWRHWHVWTKQIWLSARSSLLNIQIWNFPILLRCARTHFHEHSTTATRYSTSNNIIDNNKSDWMKLDNNNFPIHNSVSKPNFSFNSFANFQNLVSTTLWQLQLSVNRRYLLNHVSLTVTCVRGNCLHSNLMSNEIELTHSPSSYMWC